MSAGFAAEFRQAFEHRVDGGRAVLLGTKTACVFGNDCEQDTESVPERARSNRQKRSRPSAPHLAGFCVHAFKERKMSQESDDLKRSNQVPAVSATAPLWRRTADRGDTAI